MSLLIEQQPKQTQIDYVNAIHHKNTLRSKCDQYIDELKQTQIASKHSKQLSYCYLCKKILCSECIIPHLCWIHHPNPDAVINLNDYMLKIKPHIIELMSHVKLLYEEASQSNNSIHFMNCILRKKKESKELLSKVTCQFKVIEQLIDNYFEKVSQTISVNAVQKEYDKCGDDETENACLKTQYTLVFNELDELLKRIETNSIEEKDAIGKVEELQDACDKFGRAVETSIRNRKDVENKMITGDLQGGNALAFLEKKIIGILKELDIIKRKLSEGKNFITQLNNIKDTYNSFSSSSTKYTNNNNNNNSIYQHNVEMFNQQQQQQGDTKFLGKKTKGLHIGTTAHSKDDIIQIDNINNNNNTNNSKYFSLSTSPSPINQSNNHYYNNNKRNDDNTFKIELANSCSFISSTKHLNLQNNYHTNNNNSSNSNTHHPHLYSYFATNLFYLSSKETSHPEIKIYNSFSGRIVTTCLTRDNFSTLRPVPNFPYPNHKSINLGNALLITGGINESIISNEVFLISLLDNIDLCLNKESIPKLKISQIHSLNYPREDHNILFLPKLRQIIVAGGNLSKTCECLTITSTNIQPWTQLPNLNKIRANATMFLVNDTNVYCVGGFDHKEEKYQSGYECLNMLNIENGWKMCLMKEEFCISTMGVIALRDKMILVGGFQGGKKYLNSGLEVEFGEKGDVQSVKKLDNLLSKGIIFYSNQQFFDNGSDLVNFDFKGNFISFNKEEEKFVIQEVKSPKQTP